MDNSIYGLLSALRRHREIAMLLSLILAYYFGSFTCKILGLGAATAVVIIGPIGIRPGMRCVLLMIVTWPASTSGLLRYLHFREYGA